MKYTEYTVYTLKDAVAEVSDMITSLGKEELIINDPDEMEEFFSEDGNFKWNYVDSEMIEELKERAYVRFYLHEGESLSEEISEYIKQFDYSCALVDDEDWKHRWEEYFVPFYIAENIVIKPVWRDYEPKEGDIVINIDPGLAFGTGSSPTTYLASRLLRKYLKEGDRLLDVGCGTGIQSLIGSKLGASRILAVDLDPEAVKSTALNASLNGAGNIEVRKNDLVKDLDFVADTVVANLTGPLVIELCRNVSDNMHPGSILIASGIIDDMERSCRKALEEIGMEILETVRDGCWSAIAAKKVGDTVDILGGEEMKTDNEKRAACRSDWKTEPMPGQNETFVLNRAFSEEEMKALRLGHVPEAMEDKWFWYMEGSTLWAHRSWTGYCIYRIDMREDNMHIVTVNRDPEQYKCTVIAEDKELLNRLLDWWTRAPYDHCGEWLSETYDALEKAGKE